SSGVGLLWPVRERTANWSGTSSYREPARPFFRLLEHAARASEPTCSRCVLRKMLRNTDEATTVDESLSTQWFDPLFRAEAMRRVFSDDSRLQGILDSEAGLARVQARLGIIPTEAAVAITGQCRAELFDIAALAQATALAGSAAIPVVNELTRLVAGVNPAAARYVHWGATSQDAMDTGLVLQLRQGLDLIES